MQIDPDALPDDASTLQLMLRTVLLQQNELHAENGKLRLLIQRLTRHQFGRRSEQLTPDQLQFALEELEQTIAANQAGQDAAAASSGLSRKPRTERPGRNHGALPAHLPRYEVEIDVEEKDCPCCGGTLHSIGELRTEQLDIVPSRLRVRVTRRPRYACRSCEEAVVVAPAPDRPVDGGMPTEAMITHVVVSKFADSLPLYRQAQMLERQEYASNESPLAAEVLMRVRELYAIEGEIRGHPAEYRWIVRQARSRPIVEALHEWLEDKVNRVSGSSTWPGRCAMPSDTGRALWCSSMTAAWRRIRTWWSARSDQIP